MKTGKNEDKQNTIGFTEAVMEKTGSEFLLEHVRVRIEKEKKYFLLFAEKSISEN